MKKGKTSKISGFNFAKVLYGTVDCVDLKSIYLNIQTWAEPIDENDNWNRTVLNLERSIRHSIYDIINKTIFKDNFIVDMDLRTSGIMLNKRSFLNLEVIFYLKEKNIDFKSKKIKESLNFLCKKIFEDNFDKNKYFNFYLSKKIKLTEDIWNN